MFCSWRLDVCHETNDGSGFILTNDSDGDVCDIDEIIGCTDDLARGHDATSTTDTDNLPGNLQQVVTLVLEKQMEQVPLLIMI